MKKFSIKDFIAHNSPCFGCGDLIVFQIGINTSIDFPLDTFNFLKPSVNKDYTSVALHIGWTTTLKLNIDHKTNKISTNNINALTKYLENHKLFWKCECTKCHSSMISNNLDFNLEREFIKAVGIRHETI